MIKKKIFIFLPLLLLQACQDDDLAQCEKLSNENNVLAKSYCQRSAESGNAKGQVLWAELLIGEKNYTQAVKFLEKSSIQHNPQAYFRLGELYEKGNGMEKDPDLALFYYKKACEKEYIKGCEGEFRFQQMALDEQENEKQALEQAKTEAERKAFDHYKQQEEARLAEERQKLAEQKKAEEQRLKQEQERLERQAQAVKQASNSANQSSAPLLSQSNGNGEEALQFYDGLAVTVVNGRYGFIDERGNMVIRPQFKYAGRFSRGRSAVQADNGLWGFIDTRGNYVVQPVHCAIAAYSGSDGLAGVYANGRFEKGRCVGGKWGFMDLNGNWAINPVLDSADRFIDGKAKVTYKGQTGYINPYGQWID